MELFLHSLPAFIRKSKIMHHRKIHSVHVLLFEATPTLWQVVTVEEGNITNARSFVFFTDSVSAMQKKEALGCYRRAVQQLWHNEELFL